MDKPFVKWVLGLFDNSTSGASMRKVLAVWVMVLVTRLHNKYLDTQVSLSAKDGIVTTTSWDFGTTLLWADYIMVGLLIGFIVFQDIIKLKNGNSSTTSTTEVKKETVENAEKITVTNQEETIKEPTDEK